MDGVSGVIRGRDSPANEAVTSFTLLKLHDVITHQGMGPVENLFLVVKFNLKNNFLMDFIIVYKGIIANPKTVLCVCLENKRPKIFPLS